MITPLVVPLINWSDYLKNTTMRSIDASPINFSVYAKFVASLGEFHLKNKIEPLSVLHNPGDLLKHLHFTLLISGSKELFFRVMEITDLNITHSVDKAVVSGTLKQWRNGIINCLDSYYTPDKETRETFNDCLQFFHTCGLQSIFSNYHRCQLKDGTYLLEHKK